MFPAAAAAAVYAADGGALGRVRLRPACLDPGAALRRALESGLRQPEPGSQGAESGGDHASPAAAPDPGPALLQCRNPHRRPGPAQLCAGITPPGPLTECRNPKIASCADYLLILEIHTRGDGHKKALAREGFMSVWGVQSTLDVEQEVGFL